MISQETITISKTYVDTAGFLRAVGITLTLSNGTNEHICTKTFSIEEEVLLENSLTWEEPILLDIVNSRSFSAFRHSCLQEVDIIWKGYTESQTNIIYE
tara:strand:- start:358 stop:654 length:297 start_codon:yes stop_codon:yes gene_type:complete